MAKPGAAKPGTANPAAGLSEAELQTMAGQVLEEAQARGVQSDFFFRTTFKRYLAQLRILSGLEETIRRTGLTVRKEYVKGRKNLYTNPAVAEYNRTAAAANQTVSTLIHILRSLEDKEASAGGKLKAFLTGQDDGNDGDGWDEPDGGGTDWSDLLNG